jgi:hypothetical protein
MLRTSGADEYKVMANKMAQTFSRKSAIRATSVYGAKKECRVCSAVQRNTADCVLVCSLAERNLKPSRRIAYGGNEGD